MAAFTMYLNAISLSTDDQTFLKVQEVLRGMDKYIKNSDPMSWYGAWNGPAYITVVDTQDGPVLETNLSVLEWTGWVTKLCARLTLALGMAVYVTQIDSDDIG